MKHEYFTQYVDDLHEIVLHSTGKHTAILNKLESAKAACAKASEGLHITSRGTPPKRAEAEKALKEAEREARISIERLQRDTAERVSALRRELERDIVEWARMSPKGVNQDTVTLLNSGALREADFIDLARQHKSSPTMLRLISNAAGPGPLTARINAHLSPSGRLSTFDKAAQMAYCCIDPNPRTAVTYQELWKAQAYAASRDEMTNYFKI